MKVIKRKIFSRKIFEKAANLWPNPGSFLTSSSSSPNWPNSSPQQHQRPPQQRCRNSYGLPKEQMAKLAVIRKNINRNSNKKDHKTSGRSSGTFETNCQGGDKRKSFNNQGWSNSKALKADRLSIILNLMALDYLKFYDSLGTYSVKECTVERKYSI